jgi:hypothetical protein
VIHAGGYVTLNSPNEELVFRLHFTIFHFRTVQVVISTTGCRSWRAIVLVFLLRLQELIPLGLHTVPFNLFLLVFCFQRTTMAFVRHQSILPSIVQRFFNLSWLYPLL